MLQTNVMIVLPEGFKVEIMSNAITGTWGKRSITLVETDKGYNFIFKKRSKNATNPASLNRTEDKGKTRVTVVNVSQEAVSVTTYLLNKWTQHKANLHAKEQQDKVKG